MGEQGSHEGTLDNLRILREESAGLHAKLEDGKGYEDTVGSYERIKEVSRDTQESESWQMLPNDFTAKGDAVFGTLKQLDAFFGAR